MAVLLWIPWGSHASFNPTERVLIEEKLASNSASIAFTKGIDSTYKTYEIEFWGVKPATDDSYLRMRVTTDGGSSWVSGATDYQPQGWLSAGGGAWGSFTVGGTPLNDGHDSIPFCDPDWGAGTGTFEDVTGTITIYDPADSTRRKRMLIHSMYRDYTADNIVLKGAATYKANTAINGFQWTFDSGNISTGTFRLYGVR